MPGSTTELNLQTAVDSDDNADYLTLSLANSLRTVDALFNNVSGHTHAGAHQGGPIGAAAITPGMITSAMIADGTIQAADIANGTITGAKIAASTITTGLIADGTIITADLAAGACTGAALGPDVVKTTDPAWSAWADWTATVTQGGNNPTFSTRVARYKQVGKVMFVEMFFTFTSAGSAGANILVSTLPGPPRQSGYIGLGSFVFLHAGAFRGGTVLTTDGVSAVFLIDNNNSFLGTAPSLAIASGDQLGASMTYEVN